MPVYLLMWLPVPELAILLLGLLGAEQVTVPTGASKGELVAVCVGGGVKLLFFVV